MIDILIAFFGGIITGYFLRKDREVKEIDIQKHLDEIAYYKKLCRTLAEENAEFRRRL